MIDKNYLQKYETETKQELTQEEFVEYEKIREQIVQRKVNDDNFLIDENEIKKLVKTDIDTENIVSKIFSDMQGYGKIDLLLKDDDLEEVMIIGSNKPVYVYHRQNGMMITDIQLNEIEIRQIINRIANNIQRKIDKQTPILDARLSDGSRVNATIPPITPDGPTLTIRKFKKDPLTVCDLIDSNTMTTHLAAFLWIVIEGLGIRPSNIIIAGGTGSGKTTTLNTLTSFIPPNERIISIEDTLELQIPHPHIIRTETRTPNIENKGEITMDLLLKNSLRQRPDRIIVGEVRSSEAVTLFGALNTGHSGMGTLHANSAQETITRLINPPMNVPSIMINSIDFIVMQKRLYSANGSVLRRITEVAEVVGMDMNNLQLNKIYQYDAKSDALEYTAINCRALDEIAKLKGLSYQELNMELNNRADYLNESMKSEVRGIDKMQEIINNYYVLDDNYKNG